MSARGSRGGLRLDSLGEFVGFGVPRIRLLLRVYMGLRFRALKVLGFRDSGFVVSGSRV